MSTEITYQALEEFFTQRKAPQLALRALKENAEIEIRIGGSLICAVFRKDGQLQVARREAQRPDFVFHIQPETVEILAQKAKDNEANDKPTKDNIADIGINLIKEMLAGAVRVERKTSLGVLLTRGYLEVIASGGPAIARYLGSIGFTSPTKIIALFKKLKG